MASRNDPACPAKLKAAMDALEAISGKWRIPIIIALTYGKKRFVEIQRDIEKISPKMLTKELQALEMHKLVIRKEYETKPGVVEYELSKLGFSLIGMLDELLKWGVHYRTQVIGKKNKVEL